MESDAVRRIDIWQGCFHFITLMWCHKAPTADGAVIRVVGGFFYCEVYLFLCFARVSFHFSSSLMRPVSEL